MKREEKTLLDIAKAVENSQFDVEYIKFAVTLKKQRRLKLHLARAKKRPENKTGRRRRESRPPLPTHLSKDHRKSQAADFRRL